MNDETIEQMWRFAERIAPAKFLPPELRNDPASLFYAIATGEDLGLKWTHATRSFFPSRDGGLGTKGDIMLSLLLVKGFSVDFKFTAEPIGCTCKITRPDTGTTTERTFTMEDAKRIQTIWDAKNERWLTLAEDYFYVNFPREMCQWRSLAMCARVAAPDVLSGLYLVDELGRGVEKPGTTPGPPAAAPPNPDEFKVGERPESPVETIPPVSEAAPNEPETTTPPAETTTPPADTPSVATEPPAQPAAMAAQVTEPTFDELIAAVTAKIGGEVKAAHGFIARYIAAFLGLKKCPKDQSKMLPALIKLMEVVDNKIGDLKADPEALGFALSKGVMAREVELLNWPVNVTDMALKVMASTKQTEEQFVEWIQAPIVEGVSLASLEPAALEIFFSLFELVRARAFELVDFAIERKQPITATLQNVVNCAGKALAEWDSPFCLAILDEVKKIASEHEAPAAAPTDDDWILK